MNYVNVFKVLANEHRLNILQWLKDPVKCFSEYVSNEEGMRSLADNFGVCVGLIQRRCSLSQPTGSGYLKQMEDAGLLKSKRYGMWTHYGRDEDAIAKLVDFVGTEL